MYLAEPMVFAILVHIEFFTKGIRLQFVIILHVEMSHLCGISANI